MKTVFLALKINQRQKYLVQNYVEENNIENYNILNYTYEVYRLVQDSSCGDHSLFLKSLCRNPYR
jgi:hypothetical protein